jgi:hypothetical protein
MVIWTAALFLIVEPLMGQLIEPFIYGRSAGLSPVAIVVAAAFWTWLWGPLGLLMSTPLTLCVVVLARHVDQLKFIDIMLGDQPALTPQQAAYQRMLIGDPLEAIEQARNFLKENSATSFYENILIGALRLAQADAEQGRLGDDRLEKIFKTVSEVVEDLAEQDRASNAKSKELPTGEGKVVPLTKGEFGKPVFCVPGLGRLDDCAVLIVADALRREGINARVTGATAAIEGDEASTVCVCYVENVPQARIDYAVRKLSRKAPGARITVCLLSGAEGSKITSSQQKADQPRSLKATIDALTGSKSRTEQPGTNAISNGSTFK